jgi:hypothetical protein
MKTIQLALSYSEFTHSLRNLLLRDGNHRVCVVDRPDLRLDGVVVMDDNSAEEISLPDVERFVVIARKGSDRLAKIWDAGVRHVVFEGDSPSTVHLAIISAELQLLSKDSVEAGKLGSGPGFDAAAACAAFHDHR